MSDPRTRAKRALELAYSVQGDWIVDPISNIYVRRGSIVIIRTDSPEMAQLVAEYRTLGEQLALDVIALEDRLDRVTDLAKIGIDKIQKMIPTL